MGQAILVNLDNVTVQLQGKVILKNITLSISRGEIVTLIGPNGAGKSTLVKVVLGLITANKGVVQVTKGIKIGYMPQKLHLDDLLPLTVERFIQISDLNQGSISKDKIASVLSEVGIEYLKHQSMHQLSGGELQRVLLARAMILEPDLLVLDEPAQGVDLIGQGEFYKLISNIGAKRQCGILLVSHDLNLVMAGTGTVVCLNQHICCSGHPEAVSRTPQFKALFGDIPGVALYTHHHNHHHDIEGQVIADDNAHS